MSKSASEPGNKARVHQTFPSNWAGGSFKNCFREILSRKRLKMQWLSNQKLILGISLDADCALCAGKSSLMRRTGILARGLGLLYGDLGTLRFATGCSPRRGSTITKNGPRVRRAAGQVGLWVRVMRRFRTPWLPRRGQPKSGSRGCK